MKKHTHIRQDIQQLMETFVVGELVQNEQTQRVLKWGTYLLTYLLLSLLTTLTLGCFSKQFNEQIPSGYLLFGWFLIELTITLIFISRTPLKKIITEFTNHLKWE